eukprot:Gb_06489 [translate_table: standard]
MEDLPSLLQRDYGFKPQGKSAPMSASRGINSSEFNININTGGNGKSSSLGRGKSLHEDDDIFNISQNLNTHTNFNVYDDVFGGPPKYTNPSSQPHTTMGYEDIFQSFSPAAKPSSVPVYDAPVYDEDIFGGVRGVKSSSTVTYDDVFSGRSTSPSPASIEDLLGGFGGMEPGAKGSTLSNSQQSGGVNQEEPIPGFDDLIPGFGNSEPAKPRAASEAEPQQQPSVLSTGSPGKPAEDPFVVLEAESLSSNASSTAFHDPLEEFSIPSQSASMNEIKASSNGTIGIDGIDIFDGFPQATPSASLSVSNSKMDRIPLKTSQSASPTQTSGSRESVEGKFVGKGFGINNLDKSHSKTYASVPKTDFDLASGSADVSAETTSNRNRRPMHENSTFSTDLNSHGTPPLTKSDKSAEFLDDIWLTVDEIEIFTQPTLAPPPSRAPPPLFMKQGHSSKKASESKAEAHPDVTMNFNAFSTYQQFAQHRKSSQAAYEFDKASGVSSIEELEDFGRGGSRAQTQEREETPSYEDEIESSSSAAASAAAMKEAMERAEAKLKMAKEARERERGEREKEAKVDKSREIERQERELRAEVRACEEKEREARAAKEAREKEERQREDQERERRRIEREREKEREKEREREKDRIAVERATREARERAAIEARERAERAAVERATKEARERAAAEARERAATDARERAERAAVERAAAEARERAAAEARERAAAERAAVERAAAEVRLRAERAAVERANSEARERAAGRASAERAAAAKERQRRNDNDLESFFGGRPNSAPRQRPANSDATSDAQPQNKVFSSEGGRRTPAGAPSGLRKASSTANISDDWTSLFTTTSSEEFQEFEGETAERRRARLERHQRTLERAAKALAVKNERDMQAQRDQAERHRFAETLDAEIKRWAAGKEGNLRALLSTLQYVLWPESGWQPVSLTDVITAASVKKVYRKATLCVHPDKVQQKGATIQQKYIAEKVFDLLKEAWNKFNSEELF